jgi:IstB-like ATP binding protein
VSTSSLGQALQARLGEAQGTRQVVEVLLLHRQHDPIAVHRAVREALALGAVELSAIELLVRRSQSQAGAVVPLEALGEREPLWHTAGTGPLGLRPAATLAGPPAGGSTMSADVLRSLCQTLKLPSVAREAVRLAEEAQAARGQGHLEYLLQCLQAEVDERARRRTARCLREAGFPRLKTLESFDFRRAPALGPSPSCASSPQAITSAAPRP